MPYIDQQRRKELDEYSPDYIKSSGELNYKISQCLHHYLMDNGLSYQTINDIMGALEGASQEFYRRIAAPYEDKKIQDNGDVYLMTLYKR